MFDNESKTFPDELDNFFFIKAWRIVRDNLDIILKLTLIAAFFSSIVALFLQSGYSEIFPGVDPINELPGNPEMLKWLMISMLAEFVRLIPISFLTIAFVRALPLFFQNEQVSFKEIMTVGIGEWNIFYVYTIFVFLLQMMGLILCILPGIVAMIQFAFLPFIIVHEKDASVIQRCIDTISEKKWNVFILFLLYFISWALILFITNYFLFPVSADTEVEVEQTPFSIGSILKTFVAQIPLMLLYFFKLTLLFQLYMMSRIDKGEIELVEN